MCKQAYELRRNDNTKTVTENNTTYNTDDDAAVSTEACISMNGT
jgi:hypothetical protein